MNLKKNIKNTVVLGFALFAMFFGAGNLIFPPYLGLESGGNWFFGFVCFIAVDAGLAVLALIAVTRNGGGLSGITGVLGSGFSKLLILVSALAIGPLVAIPRTAATTFELAVAPIIPDCPSIVCSIAFFALIALLSIRPSKVVDIVGKILAPLMLVALAVLIVKGFVAPLGAVGAASPLSGVIKNGLESGYQTMDMIGALMFSMVVMTSLKDYGYEGIRTKTRAVAASGLFASLWLFLVYGGLAFIGASAAGLFSTDLGQSGLLLAITNGLVGDFGAVLLGIIVTAACLTTAIGLVSSCAECFCSLANGKIKYEVMVIAICVLSCAVANLGISSIISVAAPILDLVYPVLTILVVLSLFKKRIRNENVYRGAALFALVSSVVTLIDGFTPVSLGTELLPLADLGLGWVLPAILGALVGAFVKSPVKNPHSAHSAKYKVA